MKTKTLLAGMMMMTLGWLPAWGQEIRYPMWEVFAGASGSSIQTGGFEVLGESLLLGGFQVSVTNHRWLTPIIGDSGLYRSLGLKFDFGTQHGHGTGFFGGPAVETIRIQQYLIGPQFTLFGHKVAGSIHVLLGGSTLNLRSDAGVHRETGLTIGVGGAFDVNLTDRIALRLPQIDYIPTLFQDGWSAKNARVGVGVTFRVGGRS